MGSAAATAALLGVAFLLAPPMGTDLAAQVARADFVDRYGSTPVDLGWYGGVNQHGYSLFTAWLGAQVGVPLLGGIAAVGAAAAFGWLLVRHRARRPLLGGVLGATVLVGNLVSGRVTFAVGLALGLLALCAVCLQRPGRMPRLALAAVLAAAATWASPVAGLFTGLAGGALLLSGLRRESGGPGRRLPGGWQVDRPLAESLVLCLAPALALAPMALLFGNGGTQPYSPESMKINVAVAVVVFFLLPRRRRALRVGAVLTIFLLMGAYYLPSPIGSNALRLSMLFGIPLVAAFAALPRTVLAGVLAALFWWQPPVMLDDLGRAGSPETTAAFHRSLADELSRRQPVGRVEVVPLRDHWESAYLPPQVPLARGWERQVDTARNALFYEGTLTPDRYAEWLRARAVSYVALAPDAPLDRWGRAEAALIETGLPYLREVWRNDTWRLYVVTDPTPLVAAPGRLLHSDQSAIRFAVDTPGPVQIRVRWSRWLTLTGPQGCVMAEGDNVTVRAEAAGEYRLGSSLRPSGHC
ncbi:hypothetical protein WHN02_24950 [Micromonospora sp. SH-82]